MLYLIRTAERWTEPELVLVRAATHPAAIKAAESAYPDRVCQMVTEIPEDIPCVGFELTIAPPSTVSWYDADRPTTHYEGLF